MSDAGRTAVYAAQEAAFGGTTFDEIRSIAELAATAADLTAGEWWRACGGPAAVVVAARAGTVSSSARRAGPAAGSPVEIRVAAGQATTATLAHELGHALAGVACGHDARFRVAHVDVVAMLDGGDGAGALRLAYRRLAVPAGRRSWPSPRWAAGAGFVIVR